MLFSTYVFIFGFLPITLLGFYLIPMKRVQLGFLFVCSTVFYSYWSFKYVFCLLFTVLIDFFIARAIFNSPRQKNRKILLATSICANLFLLGFFKYYDLFSETINSIANEVGHSNNLLPIFHFVLPIGISFYTFQSMSYVIDVYRRHSTAHADLLSFAAYVTLFPHQISGPLVRHNNIIPQLKNDKTYSFHVENFWKGFCFFVFGLSKKILIADLLAAAVAPLVTNMSLISNLEAWLAILGYSMQLYFDFSGYSDMAVGLGFMLNIQFPQNFNSPYKSRSITEFWQRWHISLSSWLRDYLYISLGGNRSNGLKTYRNLLLTMVIGGLWHGANWTFAIWGLFHGLLLSIERFFSDAKNKTRPRGISHWILTFFLVNLGWIFFRAPQFSTALIWLRKIFFVTPQVSLDLASISLRHKDRFFFALALSLILALFAKNTWQIQFRSNKIFAVSTGILFSICLLYLGQESPFLYYQF